MPTAGGCGLKQRLGAVLLGLAAAVTAPGTAGAWPWTAPAALSPRAAQLRDVLAERLSAATVLTPLALSAQLDVTEDGDRIRVTYRDLELRGRDGGPVIEFGTAIQTFLPQPDGRMAVTGDLPALATVILPSGPIQVSIVDGRSSGVWDEAQGRMTEASIAAAGLSAGPVAGFVATAGRVDIQTGMAPAAGAAWHQTVRASVADTRVTGPGGAHWLSIGALRLQSDSRIADLAALDAGRKALAEAVGRLDAQGGAGRDSDPDDLRALLEALRTMLGLVDGTGDLTIGDVAVTIPGGAVSVGIDRVGLATQVLRGAAEPAAQDASYGVAVEGVRVGGRVPEARIGALGFELGVDRFRPDALIDLAEAVIAAGQGRPRPGPADLALPVGGAHVVVTAGSVDAGETFGLGPSALAIRLSGLDQAKAALVLDYHHDGLRVGGFAPPAGDLPARVPILLTASDVPMTALRSALGAGQAGVAPIVRAMTEAGTALTLTRAAVDVAVGGGLLTGGVVADAGAARGAIGQAELVVRNYDAVVGRLAALADPAEASRIKAVAVRLKAMGERAEDASAGDRPLRFRFAVTADGRFTVNGQDTAPLIAVAAQTSRAAPTAKPAQKRPAPARK